MYMPNRDGTGPEGKGARTGRKMGNCQGAVAAGRGLGPCGLGLRKGLGRGMGRGFAAKKQKDE